MLSDEGGEGTIASRSRRRESMLLTRPPEACVVACVFLRALDFAGLFGVAFFFDGAAFFATATAAVRAGLVFFFAVAAFEGRATMRLAMCGVLSEP